ncbi:MAG: tRNA uridine-5-carboxymethylaminomethyl(34) synthesis GTPase MnmE [Gammaproteobacteria bacterium]|nr:tRNA uridine-5-carboxymethylaminomethyl(34) synthesis GTPase MnmE [Gammaproteobacteria bacterium]
MKIDDTICALATALGKSAINIIRVSGNDAIDIVSGITKGINLKKREANTISLAYIYDGSECLDQVLISLFKAPKSYTKEDIVEINTHGGIYVTQKILELLLSKGCRLAEPGEFTKRAFLNGRIDLSEAESVMDMIEAKTSKSLNLANRGLRGEVFEEITSLRNKIEDVLLHIEVNIDYPEYTDELQVTTDLCINNTDSLINEIEGIIKNAENKRVYKEGIDTVILGKPNVGKSSLLNALLNEEKAIVTNYEGTTRDIVEGEINLDGIILHLIDTAGVRDTIDPVEKIGIEKTINVLNKAELVLLLIDHESGLTKEDLKLLELTKDMKRIIIANKMDINSDKFQGLSYIDVSILKGTGLNLLNDKIKELFINDDIDLECDTAISSSRHIALLKRSLASLKSANESAKRGDFLDMISIDLKSAYDALGLIIGKTSNDSLVMELFNRFCLGK